MNPRHVAAVGSLLAMCACSGGEASETTRQTPSALMGTWIDDPALPLVYNASGASDARALALTKAALAGLGFSGPEAPNHDDRVFVGKRYLAWIDQTGFYGKMNGLWVLDGAAGDALDFVVKDPDGRPVNVFIPGEDGEGHFAGGYKGAEHVEFPNRVPEANDDPACAQQDWCNQYGLNEAPPFTNTRIPWWSACNAGAPSFAAKFEPVVLQSLPDGGLKLVYEGPLVKEADGDSVKDGDACHADYLFPDKVRRRVYLRVGYELHPDSNDVDRTMQIVNPTGNPSFAGDMSLIGGFVMTAWPNANYLKRINRFWRPELRETTINWAGEGIRLPGGAWTDLHARPVPTSDVVVGWIDQPFTLGVTNDYAAGRTATVSHVGPSDNQDVGGCLCAVHGAIEMGGGLIHAGISLPIAGGQSTIEARRRLTVPNALRRGDVRGRTYDVVNGLAHGIGRADPDGWYATTANDARGHMIYGPYATDWGGGAAQAVVQLKVDNNSADDGVVVTLEFNDFTTNTVFASRPIRRREFRAPHSFQRFTLQGNLDGRAGHKLEVRVYWHDISYVKVGSVAVHTSDF
ncbi:hypothetical protein LVJ94_00255 [Pendulispora rubella]|uniref:Lipoprotein n=1 Tax=Pendulispora rubella TaxID=2741070 RepID=A0ABZ2L5R1_9BACT